MLRSVVAWGAWGLLLSGCGGSVEGGSSDPGEGSVEPGPTKKPPGDAADPGVENPDADTDLGDCVRGPTESYAKPCAWVADQRCYETREMACNCACPRSRDSQCASGFEGGEYGHVWVSCR